MVKSRIYCGKCDQVLDFVEVGKVIEVHGFDELGNGYIKCICGGKAILNYTENMKKKEKNKIDYYKEE